MTRHPLHAELGDELATAYMPTEWFTAHGHTEEQADDIRAAAQARAVEVLTRIGVRHGC